MHSKMLSLPREQRRRRLQDNIKADLKDNACWTHLAEDRDS